MSFIWPLMLFSLLLIPLLAGAYVWLLRRQRQTAVELGPWGDLRNRAGRKLGLRRHLPPTIFLAGLSLLLLTAARPEMPVTLPRIEGTVILAIDVSGSMAADDLAPTRMEAAKAAARAFVEQQPPTILIGVAAFSGGGVVVQPPTDDRAAVLATIERLRPEGSTSLGQGIFSSLSAIAGGAIGLDAAALAENPEPDQLSQIGDFPSAVVVLLSDGENTAPPDPLEVAQLAADARVRIFPVGIGSPEGTVVEIDGFKILTQLQESRLRQIAGLTNGRYYQATDAESLREIYETIDLQMTVSAEKMEITSLIAGVSVLLFSLGGALTLVWFGRAP